MYVIKISHQDVDVDIAGILPKMAKITSIII